MGWQKGVHERFEVGPPPLRKSVANLPFIIHAVAGELVTGRCESFVEALLKAGDLIVGCLEVVPWPVEHVSKLKHDKGTDGAYSLKKAFAICSIRMCGWLCSWQTKMPSHVLRMPWSS